jgi:hypothetical protein
MQNKQPPFAEGAIWGRLLWPGGKMLSVQAARSILRLEFTREDTARMHELAAKARDGELTSAEQDEIRTYERVGNLLALMQSKARQRLKAVPRSNGTSRRVS